MPPLRILHCPEMVAGNPQGLARAERELGLESWAIAFSGSSFGYEADEVLCDGARNPWKRELARWQLVWRAVRDFDVIHFNFGSTLMPRRVPLLLGAPRPHAPLLHGLYRLYAGVLELRDLPLLRRLGKGIVVTFQGDDARQGDVSRRLFEITMATEVEPGYYTPQSDAAKRRRIAAFDRFADRIYALNPDLLHVLPKRAEFLPYAHIDLRDWRPAPACSSAKSPVLVHAPSHRGAKGTRFVLAAVERLRWEGLAFEFVLVEGLTQADARRLYERADLAIDQLLAGWYGGFAVELMALGKPVVAYIRADDLRFLPEAMRSELPILNATPGTVCDVLREWLTLRRGELPAVGRGSRAYVERWHDPLRITAHLKTEYEAIVASRGRRPAA